MHTPPIRLAPGQHPRPRDGGPARSTTGWRLAGCLAAALLPLAAAHAQSASCEQQKVTLAERITAAPGTYWLDTLAPGEPVPRSARAIGTCDGGTTRILMRRGKAPAPEADGGSPAPEAAAPAPEPKPKPAPPPVEKPAAPVEKSVPPPSPPPVAVRAPVEPASAAPAPLPAPAASEPTATDLMPPMPAASTGESWTDAVVQWAEAYWVWLVAVLLLPAVGWGAAWLVHRRSYDAAGLPRGPRL